MDGFAPRCVALALDGPVGPAQGWELVVKLAFVTELGAPAQLSRVAPAFHLHSDDELPSDLVGRGEPGPGAHVNLVGPWPQRARGPIKLRVGAQEWFGTRPSELGPHRADVVVEPQFPLHIVVQHEDLTLDARIDDPGMLCAIADRDDLRRQEPLRLRIKAIHIDVDTEEVAFVLRASIARPRPDRTVVLALHRSERPLGSDGLERATLPVLPQESFAGAARASARATLPDWDEVARDADAPVGSETLPLGVRSPARTALAPNHVATKALPFEAPLVRSPARTAAAPEHRPTKALPFAEPPPNSALPFGALPDRTPSEPSARPSSSVGLPFGPTPSRPLPLAPPVTDLERHDTMTMARVDEAALLPAALDELEEPVTQRPPPPLELESPRRDTLPPEAPGPAPGLPFEGPRDALAAPRAPAISFEALRAQLGTPPGAVVAPSFMRGPAPAPVAEGLNIPTFDAADRRPLDAAATAPAEDRDALRIEGLTLAEFTELRAQVLADPKGRSAALKARGLGEVRWRIIERRWASHFRTLEQKPDALVALAADMQRAARARIKPLPRNAG